MTLAASPATTTSPVTAPETPPAATGQAGKIIMKAKPKRVMPSPSVKAARRLAQASERARQIAAVILDVLGGNRSPVDAARTLELSVARYYVVEQRAILGLVSACDAQPTRGPSPDLQRQIHHLEAENRRVHQALLRQQALVRSTQRGLGIASPKPPPTPAASAKPGVGVTKGGRRKRRPMVRALRQAQRVAPQQSTNTTAPAIVGSDQRGG